MSFNVSSWAIRQPLPSVVLFALLVALGLTSFLSLPVSRFPNIDFPIVQVRVSQSGASPTELERRSRSGSRTPSRGERGQAHQFDRHSRSVANTDRIPLGTDQGRALNDIKDAVARDSAELPRTIDEPVVQRIEIEGLPIVTYAVSAPGNDARGAVVVGRRHGHSRVAGREGRLADPAHRRRRSRDPSRLTPTASAYGVTAGDVNRQLRATNVDLAGGKGDIGGREQAIRTLPASRAAQELRHRITFPGAARSGSTSSARHGTIAEPTTFACSTVSRSWHSRFPAPRARATRKSPRNSPEGGRINAKHPEVTITKIDTSVDYTIGAYQSTMRRSSRAPILAVIVVLVFLRDLARNGHRCDRAAVVDHPDILVHERAGFSLNVVSLLAITIVTGILVDDAIVEIENIVRHMRMGKSRLRAALEAADEIGLAVIAITYHDRRRVRAGQLHERDRGPVFKQFGLVVAVVGLLLPPRRAAHHADPGRLFHARHQQPRQRAGC